MKDTVAMSPPIEEVQRPTLEQLLAIWPIIERLAGYLSAGDLIVLARTSSNLRTILHGELPCENNRSKGKQVQNNNPLSPRVGEHQTSFWRNLKSKSLFKCSSKSHTRGDRTRACLYCSVPICEACIVRDSFKHRNENTFWNRTRYLCHICWADEKPVKSFRYAASRREKDSNKPPEYTDEQSSGAPANAYDETCSCTIKVNGWLCLDCKARQNSSPLAFKNCLAGTDSAKEIECFGFMCTNVIDLKDPDRERHRICLWCEKPLRRQFGSEDCNRCHAKFYEDCAMNAIHRAQKLKESDAYQAQIPSTLALMDAQNTSDPSNGDIGMLRHLDAVNYRNFLTDADCPSPESVWRSKKGIWRYNEEFLISVGRALSTSEVSSVRAVGQDKIDGLKQMTENAALPNARTNLELNRRWALGLLIPDDPTDEIWISRVLEVLKPRLLQAYLNSDLVNTRQGLEMMQDVIREQYGFDIRLQILQNHLKFWTKPEPSQARPNITNNNKNNDTVESSNEYQPGMTKSGGLPPTFQESNSNRNKIAEESLYDGDTLAEPEQENEEEDVVLDDDSMRFLTRFFSSEGRHKADASGHDHSDNNDDEDDDKTSVASSSLTRTES